MHDTSVQFCGVACMLLGYSLCRFGYTKCDDITYSTRDLVGLLVVTVVVFGVGVFLVFYAS
jgi:hypothetical protein